MIVAEFEKMIYPRTPLEDNGSGYNVASYRFLSSDGDDGKSLTKKERFTAVGYFLSAFPDATITLQGTWVNDKSHGMQYKVESSTEEINRTRKGIISFLSCGLIKGCGKKTAEKIYAFYRDEALDKLDKAENLTCIQGITEKKAERIVESFAMIKDTREILSFLAEYGISPTLSQKVGKDLKVGISEIKRNPFILTKIKGIGFPTADKIAISQNTALDSNARIEACLLYVLKANEQNGHIGMGKEIAINKTLTVLNRTKPVVSMEQLLSVLDLMKKSNTIIEYANFIFRGSIYEIETEVAKDVVRLLTHPAEEIAKVEEKIDNWEKENSVSFDKIQREAISSALNSGFSIITGGPGRGKTTVSRCIVDIRKRYGKKKDITLLAPTGRASQRLSELTSEGASTIHSRLQIREIEDYEVQDEIETEQLLCDEMSMADIFIAKALLSSVSNRCNVTWVGDIDQLPSVGPGAVLRDIIKSGVVPVVELLHIYRQAEGSGIIDNAEKIRNGDSNLEFNKKDFLFYECSTFEESSSRMLWLYKGAIQKYGWENVALLSPHHFKETASSVCKLNKSLQQLLNPADGGKKEVTRKGNIFREGDVVMQTKNDNGISNGDVGVIQSITMDDGEEKVNVIFQNNTHDYTKDHLDDLELAYAMSIHKSQGSEYKVVILTLNDGHGIMLKRNLLYTAVTRAKEMCIICGQKSAIETAINTKDTDLRVTLLSQKLKYAMKLVLDNNPFKKTA